MAEPHALDFHRVFHGFERDHGVGCGPMKPGLASQQFQPQAGAALVEPEFAILGLQPPGEGEAAPP